MVFVQRPLLLIQATLVQNSNCMYDHEDKQKHGTDLDIPGPSSTLCFLAKDGELTHQKMASDGKNSFFIFIQFSCFPLSFENYVVCSNNADLMFRDLVNPSSVSVHLIKQASITVFAQPLGVFLFLREKTRIKVELIDQPRQIHCL